MALVTLTAAALVVLCVLASLLALVLMVKLCPERWYEGHDLKTTFEHFSALNRTLFAFILALSIVSASTSLAKATDYVSTEGTALVDLYWTTRPMPEAPRERIRELTREYTTTVVDQEWPAMAEGGSSDKAQGLYDDLRRTLQDTEGGTQHETEFTRDALVQMRAVGDARRARILAVSQGIPDYLWIGLILSAMLLVLAAAAQIRVLTWPGVLTVGLLAALLSSVLIVLAAMNHPFGGAIHVDPDALRFALHRFTVIGQG